ncbi:4-hydroxythreonine-4-phosphate dehydrogenase [Spirosoma lacussanchae]|uniref:4-hydroxythreonine-4-phosphate dehydrogenase PdxA n=1 Tax=Spirosoma lacussanchae TaxID=1884249 RepID=UPI001109B566|nr:4-hydroxythreonine-4-phosphate dehydrogenase PdxA [Spirosoma lacussanchae]
MEQRQSDELNEGRPEPTPGPQPVHTPQDQTESATAARQITISQPNKEDRRENRPPNRGNRPERAGNPNQPAARQQSPNGPRQNGTGQPGNRPNNRPERDPASAEATPGSKPGGQPNNRQGGRDNRNEPRNDRDRNNGGREREAPLREADDQADRDTGLGEGAGRSRDERLVIGISLGDYNGIGPEVILKALQYNRLQKLCTPVIYGSMRVLNRYRNLIDLKDWNLNGTQTIGQISHKLTNVITCWPDQNQDIQPGQVTPEAGQAALACLQRAVDDLKAGKLDALVTAPINKYNIQSEEFKFPGHTEYLAEQFGVQDNLMFMVSPTLRVGVVTGHVPLGRVRQNVTRDRIAQKLTLMMRSLKQDFGIDKPKIAVLGLNPHAGEEGLLGNEEQDIIKPLLAEWRNKGQLVFGPYPADGFFGTRSYTKFDAVLAMYHDQGLIPFKAIAFEEGVNFTAGMPVVRTSPDHGTAYDIAGKNLADETSMLQAIYTAIDVARQRKEFLELEAGALK